MFPLDDTRFYKKPEMMAALSGAANFVHVPLREVDSFLDKAFAILNADTLDIVRAHGSGFVPKIYRANETLELAMEQFGTVCAICGGLGGGYEEVIHPEWLVKAPVISVAGGDADGSRLECSVGVACRECVYVVGREWEKIGGQKRLHWEPFPSQDTFFSCAVSVLRLKSVRKRIEANHKARPWRFDPRVSALATVEERNG